MNEADGQLHDADEQVVLSAVVAKMQQHLDSLKHTTDMDFPANRQARRNDAKRRDDLSAEIIDRLIIQLDEARREIKRLTPPPKDDVVRPARRRVAEMPLTFTSEREREDVHLLARNVEELLRRGPDTQAGVNERIGGDALLGKAFAHLKLTQRIELRDGCWHLKPRGVRA